MHLAHLPLVLLSGSKLACHMHAHATGWQSWTSSPCQHRRKMALYPSSERKTPRVHLRWGLTTAVTFHQMHRHCRRCTASPQETSRGHASAACGLCNVQQGGL